MRLRFAPSAIVLLSVVGCSSTYDASLVTTPGTEAATTTSLPVGTVAELLPRMLAEVKGLSELVAANSGDDEAATRIEQYWAAMQPEVAQKYPDLVEAFEFVVRRCRAAADRSRPADADRAYKNLQTIADTLLA
ncbi:MAG: hypothetical protein RLZ14_623 [Actinomycetota bacterium]|jgi:hypothetical protein